MQTNTTIIDALNAHTDAKAGKEITKVVFLMDKAEEGVNSTPFAFFPEDRYTNNHNNDHFESYAHVGQHSPCQLAYAKACELATPEQYNDLKRELEGLGYNLEITSL